MPGGNGGAENAGARTSLFSGDNPNNLNTAQPSEMVVPPSQPQAAPQPVQPSAAQMMPHGLPYGYRTPPKPTFLQKMQGLAALGNILIFAYIFLGEVFLPDHLRATTFLGKRLGGIQGETALYAAPQQAEAVTIVDGAKANVEIEKTCTINLREAARTVYTQCMAKPEGSHPICNLERQFYLDANSCDLGADPTNQ